MNPQHHFPLKTINKEVINQLHCLLFNAILKNTVNDLHMYMRAWRKQSEYWNTINILLTSI